MCDDTEDTDERTKEKIGDLKAIGDNMARRLGAVKYMECDIVAQYESKEVFDEVS